MLIKILTGVLKDAILEVSVDDEYQLSRFDSTIEFIIKQSSIAEYPVGLKFNLTDVLAENILFERYKKVKQI